MWTEEIKINVEPLKKKEKVSFGVDMGGSHFSVYVITETGETIGEAVFTGDFDDKSNEKENGGFSKKELAVLDKLTELIGECNSKIDHERYEVMSVGFGVPGIFEGTRIKKLTNIGLEDFDLGEELKKRLGEVGLDSNKVQIKMVNDATAATYAEMYHEKGAFYKKDLTGIIITLGTGVGGEITKDGIIPDESPELGHFTFNYSDAKECGCGNLGCFEIYASARELRRDISKILGRNVSDDKEKDKTFDGFETEALLNKARGEKVPNLLLDKLKENKSEILNILDNIDTEKLKAIGDRHKEWKKVLIAGLPTLINFYRSNGEKIVLGGAGNFFLNEDDLAEINEGVNMLHMVNGLKAEIVKSKMPTKAGGIGAAMIALHEERQQAKLIEQAEDILKIQKGKNK